jgi:hypothetical protein
MIEDGVLQAFRILVQTGVVYGVYAFAKSCGSDRWGGPKPVALYVMALGASLFFGMASCANTGFQSSDRDPLRGFGDTELVSENNEDERAANGIATFLVLATASVLGVRRGLKERQG